MLHYVALFIWDSAQNQSCGIFRFLKNRHVWLCLVWARCKCWFNPSAQGLQVPHKRAPPQRSSIADPSDLTAILCELANQQTSWDMLRRKVKMAKHACWWVWGFLYLCEFGISFIWLEFTINGLGFWRMPLKRKMCWSHFGYSRHIGSVQNCLWMMMLVGLYYPFYRDHHNPWTGQSHGLMDTTDTTMVVTSIAWNLTPTTSYNYGYVTRLRRTAP
jgi:hypothetical protein